MTGLKNYRKLYRAIIFCLYDSKKAKNELRKFDKNARDTKYMLKKAKEQIDRYGTIREFVEAIKNHKII